MLEADTGQLFRLYATATAKRVADGETTTCEAMATMYDALAKYVEGAEFASILKNTLVGADAVSWTESDDAIPHLRGNRAPIEFPSTGFASAYARDGHNPVRHFTFYFWMSAHLGGDVLARVTSYGTDELQGQPTDYALTRRAIGLAEIYGQGESGIGDSIRATLCR